MVKIALKDLLFNRSKVLKIAGEIYGVYPAFQKDDFARDVIEAFLQLELKARIIWIAECLKKYLPRDFPSAVRILLEALPPPNDPNLTDDDFGDFIYAPYAEYVAKNGCNKRDLEKALKALKAMTTRFSAEDAIRYFINAFPEETLQELLIWTGDAHYHVRRLCSEGTRPKLPWARKIKIPMTAPLPILDRLYSDCTRFVTRSVANHLNDLSKIDPDLVVNKLRMWRESGSQKPKEMGYIIRHALRTLVKKGHPKALQLLGFSDALRVSVADFEVPAKVRMGTFLEFSFMLQAQENTAVIVDYIIYFQNKLGKRSGRKVFKLKQMSLKKNQSVRISKRHLLRQFMTTRTLYTGPHEIELQINGKSYGRGTFELAE